MEKELNIIPVQQETCWLSGPARWVLCSTWVTNIGNGLSTLTVGKLLYDRTGSVAAFGIVIIVDYVLSFLLQVLAGPFVDRGSLQKTCSRADISRGLFVCFASFMLTSSYFQWWILASVVVIDIAKPFYRSATFSLGPLLVPKTAITKYYILSNSLLQIGQMMGAALAFPIIQYYGTSVAFGINGISFLISGTIFLFVRISSPERQKVCHFHGWGKDFLKDWREVGKLLSSNLAFCYHIFLCASGFLVVSFVNLNLVPLVDSWYQGTTYWLSLFDGSFAIGAIISSTLTMKILKKTGMIRALPIGIGIQAALFFLLAVVHVASLTIIIMGAMGACNAFSLAILLSNLQKRCQETFRGRISALQYLVVSVLSSILIPILSNAQKASLERELVVIAIICASFSIFILLLSHPSIFGKSLLGLEDSN